MSTTAINHKLPATYGLVVCGGNSSRMNSDKSLLSYYGKPQRYHVYEMMEAFCERVFISCNKGQVNSMEPGYEILPDDAAYQNTGPMAALLSAFDQFPGKNILFLGCDYPFVSEADIHDLALVCKPGTAAAFYNEQEGLYEPLLAWYPYQSFNELKKMYSDKQFSLQHFLKQSTAIKCYPKNKNSILSIDSPDDFIRAYNMINP